MLIKKEGFLLTVVFPLGNDHSFHTKLFANPRKTTGLGVVIEQGKVHLLTANFAMTEWAMQKAFISEERGVGKGSSSKCMLSVTPLQCDNFIEGLKLYRLTSMPQSPGAISCLYALVIGFPEGGGDPGLMWGLCQLCFSKLLYFPTRGGFFSCKVPSIWRSQAPNGI